MSRSLNFSNISKVMFAYPVTRYLDRFYNVKSLIANESITSDKRSEIQKIALNIEDSWIGNREIRDCSTKESMCLSWLGSEILRSADVIQRASQVYIRTDIARAFDDGYSYRVYGRIHKY